MCVCVSLMLDIRLIVAFFFSPFLFERDNIGIVVRRPIKFFGHCFSFLFYECIHTRDKKSRLKKFSLIPREVGQPLFVIVFGAAVIGGEFERKR